MPAPGVPPKLRHLMSEPALAEAWELQVKARRAEAAKVAALLEHVAAYREHYDEPTFMRDPAERAAVHQAALVMGFSDHTTMVTLNAAEYARDHLPWTWEAFTRGVIDLLRLRRITSAAETLGEHHLASLDPAAALEATDRSLGDLQNWLTRYIATVDHEAYTKQCAANRRHRYVQFSHGPDGVSYIDARLPTIEVAAIQKRLRITARRHHGRPTSQAQTGPAAGAGSDGATASAADQAAAHPTLAQREADLFSAWLRTGDTPEEGARPVEAKIMVMIPEATLAGNSQQPGMSADRSWMLDADQARDLAANNKATHEWYAGKTRTNKAAADVDVLSVTYAGRYPPARLRDALLFRDGICTTQGCTVPAEQSDIDHHLPWEAGGATTGSNLQALCRRHHKLKSHGLLQPPARGAPDRAGRTRTTPTAVMPDFVWGALPISV